MKRVLENLDGFTSRMSPIDRERNAVFDSKIEFVILKLDSPANLKAPP
jgi:hypothetical protein